MTRLSPHPSSLPAKPPPATLPPVPTISVSTDATIGERGDGKEVSVVSGERQEGRKLSIRGQHARDRQRRKRKDSSPLRSAGSGASTPVSAEDGAQLSTSKRLKTGTEEETPSLLLRMGHPRRVSPVAGGRHTSRSKSRRSTPEVQSQRLRSNSPRRHGHSQPSADAEGLPDLSLGISIKGAARSHSHSLLERIQGNET